MNRLSTDVTEKILTW